MGGRGVIKTRGMTTATLALGWGLLLAWPAAAQGAPPASPAKTDIRASAAAKFKAIDSNGDGFLDAAEIAAAAAENFKLHNRDGKSVLAVPRGCRGPRAARKSGCEVAALDINRDRKVTAGEHHRVMRQRIMAADANRDGKISLDEYVAWSAKGVRQTGRVRR